MVQLEAFTSPKKLYQLRATLQLTWEDKGTDIWEAHGYFNEAQHWKGHEETKKIWIYKEN